VCVCVCLCGAVIMYDYYNYLVCCRLCLQRVNIQR